jgi:putative lipoic acid-binding regulatory protein
MDRAAALALLEAQHQFPSDHAFHVIVRHEEDHVAEVASSIAALLGLPHLEDRIVRVPSREGTYVSLRMRLPCAEAATVLDVYARLGTLSVVVRYF